MKTWLRVAITLLLCAALLIFVVDVRVVGATLARCDLLWALATAGVSAAPARPAMARAWGSFLMLVSFGGW